MKKVFTLIPVLLLVLWSCTEVVIFDFEENLARELAILDGFIAENNIPVEVHESDIRYQVIREGVGDDIKEGDTVLYYYQIYLLDSTLIETNIEEVRNLNNLPSGTIVPSGEVVRDFRPNSRFGFLNTTYQVGKQENKVHLFVPSYQAFGPRQRTFNFNRTVLPYTPLLIEIEIVEVRPGD